MFDNRSIILIDKEALVSNLQFLCERSATTDFCAVVKANAYGHGLKQIAGTLHEQGVNTFAVSSVSEGVKLRQFLNDSKILVFPDVYDDKWESLRAYRLIPVIHDLSSLRSLLSNDIEGLEIHIEVDTGMGRTGLQAQHFQELSVLMEQACQKHRISGVYTHLASSFKSKPEFSKDQKYKLLQAYSQFKQYLNKEHSFHLYNSVGNLTNQQPVDLGSRIGLSLYGIAPIEDEICSNLKPVLSWISKPIQLKTVNIGEGISYESTWVATRSSVIATIPVGYGDGYPRSLSNKGRVIINGCYASIVGNICMDYFMVDVTDISNVTKDSRVTLIGADGRGEISVHDLANIDKTIPYEILCRLNSRILNRSYN